MSAGIYDFIIEQGATWSRTFYLASNSGLRPDRNSSDTMTINATAKTITRNDGGSWITDGITVGAYLVNGKWENRENNGSHLVSAVTATVITCATSTFVTETAGHPAWVMKAFDLTGYTGVMEIYKEHSSLTPTATATVTFDPIRTNGGVTLSLSNTTTAAIPAGDNVDSSASQYVSTFKITKSGVTTRVFNSKISIDPE